MIFDLMLATIGVATAMGTQPMQNRSLGTRTVGVLSLVLGLRLAVMSSCLIWQQPAAGLLWAQEPDRTASVTATTAEAKSPPAETLPRAEADEPSTDNKAATATVAPAESADPAESLQSAGSERTRKPIERVANVHYLSANRPSWVETPPTYDGDVLQVAVLAGPYRTVRECEPELAREVTRVVDDFVNQYLEAPHASNFIKYSLDDLRRRKVVKDQFTEQLEISVGLMNQVHALLVFDNDFRNELDLRWSEVRSKSRLAQTGLGAGVVLLMLGTLFSYFRVDTATKGYYTRRLQFATAGAILALVTASVVLTKFIPWM